MRKHGSICYHCYHEFRALHRAVGSLGNARCNVTRGRAIIRDKGSKICEGIDKHYFPKVASHRVTTRRHCIYFRLNIIIYELETNKCGTSERDTHLKNWAFRPIRAPAPGCRTLPTDKHNTLERYEARDVFNWM